MLHIILLILKIIGITILILLGILLVLLACVLFIPIRYHASGEGKNLTWTARGNVSWLLHMIHVGFAYEQKTFAYEVYVFGIPLLKLMQRIRERREKQKSGKRKTLHAKQGQAQKQEQKEESNTEQNKEQNTEQSIEQGTEQNTEQNAERNIEAGDSYENKDCEKEKSSSMEENPVSSSDEQKASEEKQEDRNQTKSEQKPAGAAAEAAHRPVSKTVYQSDEAAEAGEHQTCSSGEKGSKAESQTYTDHEGREGTSGADTKWKQLLKNVWSVIRGAIHIPAKVYHVLQQGYEKITSFVRLLTSEEVRHLKKTGIRYGKKIAGHIRPRHVQGEFIFGFEDPSLTGELLGGIACFYPWLPRKLAITPDFENPRLEGELTMSGRICCICFVVWALQILFDKKTIPAVKHVMNKEE